MGKQSDCLDQGKKHSCQNHQMEREAIKTQFYYSIDSSKNIAAGQVCPEMLRLRNYQKKVAHNVNAHFAQTQRELIFTAIC